MNGTKSAPPFNPARLVIPASTSVDQRWFIKFWVWDEQQQKKITKKDYQCNSIAPGDRMRWVQNRIEEINQVLEQGYHINRCDVPGEFDPDRYLLLSAIEHFLSNKSSLKQFRSYLKLAKKFQTWLVQAGYAKILVKDFRSRTLQEYINWLRIERHNGIRSVNNAINFVSTVYNHINDYREGEARFTNPTLAVDKQKNPLGRNLAYTNEQVKELLAFMTPMPALKRCAMTMYYTLARTDELAQLKIWMVGFLRDDQIHFPASICKNGISKNVVINTDLRQVLDEMHLDKYPKDWYVFSTGFKPGPNYYGGKSLGGRYGYNVLRKLNYSHDYTLYSWKHTGVVRAFFAGVSKAALMLQAGWTDTSSFDTYLKSLGCFDNPEIQSKYPSLNALSDKEHLLPVQ